MTVGNSLIQLQCFAWLCATLAISTAAGAAPPPNDLFADATMIEGLIGEIEASFSEATADGEPASVAQHGSSVWYRWTAPESRCMVLETVRDAMCPTIAVFTGADAPTAQLVAADQGGGGYGSGCHDSRLTFHAAAGLEYRIMLDGANFSSADPRAKLLWTFAGSGPANDNFANAQPITGAVGSLAGSNVGATQECGEASGTGPSVWYSWIAPFSGRFAFTTDGVDNGFDSTLAVYTGDQIDALTLIGFNDDGPDYSGAGGRPSKVVLDAVEGVQYRITVNGFVQGKGAFRVNQAPTAGNDDFDNALEILGSSGGLMANNLAATHEEGEPLHTGIIGIYAPLRSIWYRWQAPSTDRVTFLPGGSDYFADVFVYTGSSVDALTPAPRAYAGVGGASNMVGYSFDAVAGTNYRIVVDGVSAGKVVLTWVTGKPENDDAANAEVISGVSGTAHGTTIGATLEPNEPINPFGSSLSSPTIWYRWDAPADGNATVDLSGTDYQGILAVYTGETPETLTHLVGGYLAPNASAGFLAESGRRYYLQIWLYPPYNQVGSTTLNWLLQVFTPTPTQIPTATETSTPPNTSTETPTATPTLTATAVSTPTNTTTQMPSRTPTQTLPRTATAIPTGTPTSTATVTPANTPPQTATVTLTQTSTASVIGTLSGTPTSTQTVTPGFTQTLTATPPHAPSPTSSHTATNTPTPTPTGVPLRPGDVNCDGVVSAADLPALVQLLPSGEPGPCGGDLTGSDVVDAADLAAMIEEMFEDLTQSFPRWARPR